MQLELAVSEALVHSVRRLPHLGVCLEHLLQARLGPRLPEPLEHLPPVRLVLRHQESLAHRLQHQGLSVLQLQEPLVHLPPELLALHPRPQEPLVHPLQALLEHQLQGPSVLLLPQEGPLVAHLENLPLVASLVVALLHPLQDFSEVLPLHHRRSEVGFLASVCE